MWEVEYTDEFGQSWRTLAVGEQEALTDRIRLLGDHGPALKRPVVRHYPRLAPQQHEGAESLGRRQAAMRAVRVRSETEAKKGARTLPNTRSFSDLHDQVLSRPGAKERLAALRKETLAEIGLYEIRKCLDWSQSGLATELGISQAAVSQLENAQDLTLSRLSKYLEPLGARLRILAVFEDKGEEYSIPIRIGRKAS